jgi:hypothetical protein
LLCQSPLINSSSLSPPPSSSPTASAMGGVCVWCVGLAHSCVDCSAQNLLFLFLWQSSDPAPHAQRPFGGLSAFGSEVSALAGFLLRPLLPPPNTRRRSKALLCDAQHNQLTAVGIATTNGTSGVFGPPALARGVLAHLLR